MTLRELLYNALKTKRLRQAVGATLTQEWQGMTAAQKDAFVQKIMDDPCEAGKQLRTKILTAIEASINNDLDTILAQPTIDRAALENLIN